MGQIFLTDTLIEDSLTIMIERNQREKDEFLTSHMYLRISSMTPTFSVTKVLKRLKIPCVCCKIEHPNTTFWRSFFDALAQCGWLRYMGLYKPNI